MKSGATLALHKFCFIKQSMKSTKNQHYQMTNGKEKALAGLKGANLLKDTSFASVWGFFSHHMLLQKIFSQVYTPAVGKLLWDFSFLSYVLIIR